MSHGLSNTTRSESFCSGHFGGRRVSQVTTRVGVRASLWPRFCFNVANGSPFLMFIHFAPSAPHYYANAVTTEKALGYAEAPTGSPGYKKTRSGTDWMCSMHTVVLRFSNKRFRTESIALKEGACFTVCGQVKGVGEGESGAAFQPSD